MRTTIFVLFLTACVAMLPIAARSQTVSTSEQLPGNAIISVEKFEWIVPEPKAPVAARLVLKNNTGDKTIRFVQLTLVAQNKQGVTLQNDGATLRKLSDTAHIAPSQTGTLYFKKAFTIDGVDKVIIKQIIVEFTNGSLEILQP